MLRKKNLFLMISFLLITIFGEQASAPAQTNWYWSSPLPSGNLLNSIFPANDNVVYAAGSFGTIMRSTDGGKNWKLLPSPLHSEIFEIISIKENICIAVGKSGKIIKSTDGGNGWTEINSKTSNDLHDVCFVNRYSGYICGLNGTVLKTIDGGDSWSDVSIKNGASFFCLSFLNEKTGVVAGYNSIAKTTNGGASWILFNVNHHNCSIKGTALIDSNIIIAAADFPHGILYKSTDGGNSWNEYSLDLPFLYDGAADLVRSMKFVDSTIGFVVTNFGTILKTTDCGMQWTRDSSFRPFEEKNFVMSDVQSYGSNNLKICGAGGAVFSSTDCANSWSVQSGNRKNIHSSFFINCNVGYACGENGIILKTEDGGKTWNEIRSFISKSLNALFFFNEKTGYAAGNNGATFLTTDGAQTWSDQTHYTQLNYRFIHFVNYNDGVAGGGNPENGRAFIYRTSNAGTNWYEVFDSLGLGILNSVAFIDHTSGIAAGNNGNILYTYDAGSSWIPENISTEDLNCISFNDSLKGMIAADNGFFYLSTNGGSNWFPNFTGNYRNIYSINYRNNYAVACGDDGLIISSTDGGVTWQSSEKITNNRLYSVNDELNYIALGEYGTILFSPKRKYISHHADSTADKIFLSQNFPNPFNSQTRIGFSLPNMTKVRIKLYDVSGREIRTLADRSFPEGYNEVIFNAETIQPLPSGIYFYILSTPRKSTCRKMLILK